MKTYKIHLIRHGLTEGNLAGQYIGRTDLPLCEQGRKDIEVLIKKGIYPDVDKVYSSPLTRCLDTAELIFPEKKLMIVDDIAEMDFGTFEGKKQEDIAQLPEYIEWIKGGMDAAPPEGESFGDFSLRLVSGLDLIFSDMCAKDIARAAVITHAGVITSLMVNFGLPKGKPADFMCIPGSGFEILMSAYLWQQGPTFEIGGRLI